ncbi:MAG: TrmH family RNA methyltransferase [Candidatus Jorgensenbacteria bacterium]|nr:TrmH family RNA methyltransferase [Candidatus Jorgensenbacteria bacterium]
MKEVIAVLSDIRSIHNVGSIFRTADSAGIKELYLCGITPSPLDRFGRVRPEFAKVALGAERFVKWESKKSTVSTLSTLSKKGYAIVAIEQADTSKPYTIMRKNNGKVALVVGNEVNGLSKTVLKKADTIIEIPMRGEKESLNVSVAFGVVAYGIQY